MDTDAKNRTIRLGDVTFEIIDPNSIEPVFADLITDGREAKSPIIFHALSPLVGRT